MYVRTSVHIYGRASYISTDGREDEHTYIPTDGHPDGRTYVRTYGRAYAHTYIRTPIAYFLR